MKTMTLKMIFMEETIFGSVGVIEHHVTAYNVGKAELYLKMALRLFLADVYSVLHLCFDDIDIIIDRDYGDIIEKTCRVRVFKSGNRMYEQKKPFSTVRKYCRSRIRAWFSKALMPKNVYDDANCEPCRRKFELCNDAGVPKPVVLCCNCRYRSRNEEHNKFWCGYGLGIWRNW